MTHRGIHLDGRALPAATAVDPGPAPMLQWIDLDRLVIDEAYQRPLGRSNWVAIEKIAANFQWSRFGPVLVAPVAGGLYAVIDGQHRAHAAALCGILQVPAMVVQVDLAAQAKSFAWVNSQTIKVTPFHIFKAALAAGEDWAVRADAAVAAAGCRLMTFHPSAKNKRPGEVYCIGLIRKQIEAGNDWAVTAGLAAIRSVPSLDSAVGMSDYLLGPWIAAVAAEGCRDAAILSAALRARNPFKVIERAYFSLDLSIAKSVRAREDLRRGIAEVAALAVAA